jgi:hypothetical protein
LDCHIHLTSKRQNKERQALVGSIKYKSKLQDQAGLDDKNAKKKVSQYTYDKLWMTLPSGKENPGATPLLGTLKAAPNVYHQKRKKSSLESKRKIIQRTSRNPSLSVIGRSNVLAILPEPRAREKTCSICRCRRHQHGSCPKIHKFKKPPFAGRYHTEYCPTADVREVSATALRGMLGIVIQRQFFVFPKITNIMCRKCTFSDNLGDAHLTFQNYLFTSECILAYLTCSKSNVAVCKLEDSCIEGYESFGFSLSQSQQNVPYPQQNIQYLSQSDQMGYGIVSKSDQIGFGLSEPL